jgi:flagellar L-ring protein precursor FlgH
MKTDNSEIAMLESSKHNFNFIILSLQLITMLFSLSGCYVLDRLKSIGREPEFSEIDLGPSINDESGKGRDHYASGENEDTSSKSSSGRVHANSILDPNSSKFFKYKSAWREGDIVKVKVKIQDKATLDNKTNQGRSSKDSMSTPNLFGLGDDLAKSLSSDGDKNNLVGANSSHTTQGNGNVTRNENINMDVAAVVKKVLPNGNLLISGQQEVRVNYEKRNLGISGIVRTKDISSDDSVMSNQIAEARISYGGKGTISEMQQPRYGAQVLDAVAPY